MLSGERKWGHEKIYLLFKWPEAEAIFSVPLIEGIQEDRLIWNEEQDGLYSVQSGYRKMKENRWRAEAWAAEPWGWLWKIQAPPKAKHLMWQICKECLPMRTRLRGHHGQCQLDCPLCQEIRS
ncbi:polynucleotidyl transferase ribonuclease H fold [Trifolium medium]|uniref:Polynucleotidyl transferase ribonuclease H fold n=1 Tax=Trifolium medium TaxID=97028 RepID=A0A392M008_9FABA|nr:polynucleotidyl transferase ribonuclease H fold [Trifolium medium]